jgi:hypothetical protein
MDLAVKYLSCESLCCSLLDYFAASVIESKNKIQIEIN